MDTGEKRIRLVRMTLENRNLRTWLRITVKLGGVLVYDDQELAKNGTLACSIKERIKDTWNPILLQDHDKSVCFHNIWVKENSLD